MEHIINGEEVTRQGNVMQIGPNGDHHFEARNVTSLAIPILSVVLSASLMRSVPSTATRPTQTATGSRRNENPDRWVRRFQRRTEMFRVRR
jgi:hypothetical protein